MGIGIHISIRHGNIYKCRYRLSYMYIIPMQVQVPVPVPVPVLVPLQKAIQGGWMASA
jgi:hypothetical protein